MNQAGGMVMYGVCVCVCVSMVQADCIVIHSAHTKFWLTVRTCLVHTNTHGSS